ncbi:MAG TPA: hypothetical protein VNS10_15875 [Gemmatimonadaceae bacterium]|jgi:hypothetical protein|nr:hypothetical protein [Gemmatimonadaceae bacterium]
MLKYTRRLGPSLLVAAALLGACSSESKKGPDSLGADSTLNRDLAMANRDSTAQPALKDVPASQPAAPAPERSAPERSTPKSTAKSAPKSTPKTSPPPPAPVTTASGNTVTSNPSAGKNPSTSGGGSVGSIPAGATLTANSSARVCTNTNNVGDHVTATIANAVTGSNGASIPAGATLNLTVTRLKRSENSNDPVVLEFAVNSVTFDGHTYPIEGSIESAAVERVKDQPGDKTAQKVAIGAVAGAVAGKILGKSTKGAVIGGAAGAAAGAAAAAATANYQGCVPAGGQIVIKLTSAATVRAAD